MNRRIPVTVSLSLSIALLGLPAIAANPDQVQRLLKTNQCPLCDLSGANLREANLYGANLVGADLKGTDLTGANLGSANFTDADLSGAKLSRTYLYLATLENTRLNQADLSGAYLRDALIVNSSFVGANLSGANLSRVNLSNNDLRQTNLSNANLSGSMLTGVRLLGTSGRQASDLAVMQFSRYLCQQTFDYTSAEEARSAGVELSFANLSGVNLQGANLSDVILANANLTNADLSGANLQGACLRGSKLNNAKLDGVDLKDAILIDAVVEGASFKEAKNADLKDTVTNPNQVQTSAEKAKQSEGRSYVGSLNRAQQAYFLEMDKFASQVKDLGLGIRTETTNYLYRTFPQGKGNQRRVINAGIARVDRLKSYIGLVVLEPATSTKDMTSLAFLCESEEPTKFLPPVDILSRLNAKAPCPPGYKLLDR